MLRKLRTTINSSSFSTLETDISSIPVANLSTFALSPQIFPAYILLHLYPPTSWKSRAFLNPVSCANAQTNNKNCMAFWFSQKASSLHSAFTKQTNKTSPVVYEKWPCTVVAHAMSHHQFRETAKKEQDRTV